MTTRRLLLAALARTLGVIIIEPGHQYPYPHEPYPNPRPEKFYRWIEFQPDDIGYHPAP